MENPLSYRRLIVIFSPNDYSISISVFLLNCTGPDIFAAAILFRFILLGFWNY